VDESILDAFTKAELETPTPRKIIGENIIYMSRQFGLPKVFGDVLLSDFGAAVSGDEKRNHDAQPKVYRAPEVMLKMEWSYPVDIWNVGAMVSWLSLSYLTNVEHRLCLLTLASFPCRFGTSIKTNIYSMEKTLTARATLLEHILLKCSACSVLRRLT
jgi:hypothetical protein